MKQHFNITLDYFLILKRELNIIKFKNRNHSINISVQDDQKLNILYSHTITMYQVVWS